MDSHRVSTKDVISMFSKPQRKQNLVPANSHNIKMLEINSPTQQVSKIPLHIFVSPLIHRGPDDGTRMFEDEIVAQKPSKIECENCNAHQLPYSDRDKTPRYNFSKFSPYSKLYGYRYPQRYIFDRTLDKIESKTSLIYKTLRGGNSGKRQRLSKPLVLSEDEADMSGAATTTPKPSLGHNFAQLYGNQNEKVYAEVAHTPSHYVEEFRFSPKSDISCHHSIKSAGSEDHGTVSEYFSRPEDPFARFPDKHSTSGYGSSFEDSKSVESGGANDNFVWNPSVTDFATAAFIPSNVFDRDEWEVPGGTENADGTDYLSMFEDDELFEQIDLENVLNQSSANEYCFDTGVDNSASRTDEYFNFNPCKGKGKKNFGGKNKLHRVKNTHTPLITWPEDDGTFAVEESVRF